MAYCIFDVQPVQSRVAIVDWDVVNLMESVEKTTCLCGVISPTKAKSKSKANVNENHLSKTGSLPCGKKAKYSKLGMYYCEKHAKTHGEYQLPSKEHTPAFLKKQKVDVVSGIYHQIRESTDKIERANKTAMIDTIVAYYDSRSFSEIEVSKPKKTANDTDLVSIGWAIQREFDRRAEHLEGITHVIIENQISPIATRMKTIQGMLTQYFIMKSESIVRGAEPIDIRYISSSNKLIDKGVGIATTPPIPETIREESTETPENSKNAKSFKLPKKSSYRSNKKDGIVYCSRYLDSNPEWSKWMSMMNTPKKDDLADCFLQGIWFLKSQKTITCAENLKINIV